MAWGQDFLQAFAGFDGLKDYAHASKTFLTNGYEQTPRQKFLFHVYFNLNVDQIPALASAFPSNDEATIGLMVKTIQLPNYTISVDTMNQYNRKRLVQTKIDYNPVQIEFHDDGGDLIRTMWYNYFKYYYKDPSNKYDNITNVNGIPNPLNQTPAGFSYNNRDTYSPQRFVNDWGYIGEANNDGLPPGSSKPPFFKDIRIYGMSQHKFAEYILINPMITDWAHDTYDYSQGNGIMNNRMTVRYETVKYLEGAIGGVRPDTNALGFADPSYYDTVPSALARPGSTHTVLGQGGLLDAGIGIVTDLESGNPLSLIGAAQTAAATYNTWKSGPSIATTLKADVTQAVNNAVRGSLPGAIRAAGVPTNGPSYNASPTGQYGSSGLFIPTPKINLTNY